MMTTSVNGTTAPMRKAAMSHAAPAPNEPCSTTGGKEAVQLFTVPGPLFAAVKVSTSPSPTSLPPRDGPYLRSRFREALLGPDAHR